MNMFEEIEKKEETLKTSDLKNQAEKITKKYNLYQIVAFVLAGIGLIGGVILGSINAESNTISEYTFNNNYNSNLMLIVWGISFIVALSFYWMGEVVEILKSIKENTHKISKSK